MKLKRFNGLPLFAAGYAFSSEIFDIILTQSYYNPLIVPFLEVLLSNGNENNRCKVFRTWIHESFHRETFDCLFEYMNEEWGMIVLALYRDCNSLCNLYEDDSLKAPLPYVFVGPSNTSQICKDDLIYVICEPKSLCLYEEALCAKELRVEEWRNRYESSKAV